VQSLMILLPLLLPMTLDEIAEWLYVPTVNAKVVTVLGSISASFVAVESEGWQMKQC
jgi:hypothetical protein